MDDSTLAHGLPIWAQVLVPIVTGFFGAFFANFGTVCEVVAGYLRPGARSTFFGAELTGILREFSVGDTAEHITHESFTLRRHGSRITGEPRTPDLKKRSWSAEGVFEGGILVLRYWSGNKDGQLGSGAIVLYGDPESLTLCGCWVGYDTAVRRIVSGPYVLTALSDTSKVQAEFASLLNTPVYAPHA